MAVQLRYKEAAASLVRNTSLQNNHFLPKSLLLSLSASRLSYKFFNKMRVSTLAALSVGAVFSTMQYCPAPFSLIAVPLVGMTEGAAVTADATLGSGVIAGGIGKIGKRANLPPGVSQHSYDQCKNQLNSAHVHLSSPSAHSKHHRRSSLHAPDITYSPMLFD